MLCISLALATDTIVASRPLGMAGQSCKLSGDRERFAATLLCWLAGWVTAAVSRSWAVRPHYGAAGD
jgi:hypothetical protein